ncbi:MAG: GumC family protein [Methylobacteriaceae bacterium]|nr:GumC family protein [Methylobacteriaceae bacterium]MBV9245832.1 GumC family protein [Methylobacteriaceae bacterium]
MFQRPQAPAHGHSLERRASKLSSERAAPARPAGLSRRLWQRKSRLALGMLVGLVGAELFLALASPRYTATAQLLIDPTDLRVVDNAVTSSNPPSDANIAQAESQVRVLVSENVLRRVVEAQALDKDVEFTRPGSRLRAALEPILAAVSAKPSAEAVEPRLAALRALELATAARREERTYVVDLSVTTEEGEKSVAIANAIVNAYLQDQAAARAAAAQRATTELSSRLQELRDRVRDAEDRAETYKAQNGIIGAGGTLINEQQLAAINAELVTARARTSEAQARFEQIQNLQRSRADPGAIAEAVQSATIANLRAQYAEVIRRQAELSSELGGRHPALADVRAQVRDLQRQIGDEIGRLVRATRGEYERALANQTALERSLDAVKRDALTTNQALVRLRELERDVEASRAVYQAFLVRSRETNEQERLDTANVRVISEATLPPKSWPPRTSLILFAGLAFGVVAGAALALARSGAGLSLVRPSGAGVPA